MPRKYWVGLAAWAALMALPQVASASIVTYGGGPARMGLYPTMQRLTPQALSAHQVGRVFNTVLPDHAQVYGQPLLAGGRLVVATEDNDVYELDPTTGRILASRALGHGWTPIMPVTVNGVTSTYVCKDLYPTVGVTSTPVIDTSADGGQGVIYLTSKQLVTSATPTPYSQGAYFMYALNLKTLANVPTFNGGQPLQLTGSVPGTNPLVQFNATFQLQRPALLESGGRIFAGFGSDCGISPYEGWITDVQASTGQLLDTWSDETEPGSRGAGIWMAGGGLMSDGPGRVFFSTGNAFPAPGYTSQTTQHTPNVPTPGDKPPAGLGESVVQLNVSGSGALTPADFFAPCDAPKLSAADMDMASGAVISLPASFGSGKTRDVLLAGGKGAQLFLLNRNALGGFEQGVKTTACPDGGDKVLGEFGAKGSIWSASAVWPYDGDTVFVDTQTTKALAYNTIGTLEVYTGGLGHFHLAARTGLITGGGSSGVMITSVGSNESTALAWVITKGLRGGNGTGTLRAYDVALGAGKSAPTQAATFSIGQYAKYVPPGIGPDAIYIAGAGHIEALGIRTK